MIGAEPEALADRRADAACLRASARILRRRAKRQTFALRVIIRVLDNAAAKIEADR